jgi:hypothetical protein
MPRVRADGRLGLMAMQSTRSGVVSNSAHVAADLGPAVMASLLRHMNGFEYNALRLASATPEDLAKWLRSCLKVKSLKDVPLPCHDIPDLLEAFSLEYRRVQGLKPQS